MELLSHCPKCSGQTFEKFLEVKDHSISKETFTLVRCISCNLVFTNPRPGKTEIGKYYESVDYVSHSDTNKGLINKIYHIVKKRAIDSKIKLINDLQPKNKSIIDIGSGTGSFLSEIKKTGWKVIGIEPNDVARETSIKLGLEVYPEGKLSTLSKSNFSIITMWHVLEHVHDLQKRVSEIFELLESGGYAIIAVPNYTSWDAKHYKDFWAAYDVPRHLYHFSPEVINSLFTFAGFFHHSSQPMKFDSYYVSMLSEKYKKTTLGIFKAFFIGLTSNLKAKSAENYSSVIYIFKKN